MPVSQYARLFGLSLVFIFAHIAFSKHNTMMNNTIVTTIDLSPKFEAIRVYDAVQINCMALTLYGEARGEIRESIVSVAWSISNREYSGRYPAHVCDVVLQRSQYEPLLPGRPLRDQVLAASSGQVQVPPAAGALWDKLLKIADDVYYGRIPDPTNGATHFYSPVAQLALGRPAPSWSFKMAYHGEVGGHKYYSPTLL